MPPLRFVKAWLWFRYQANLIEMDVVVSFDSGQFGVAVGIEQVEHPFYGIVGSGRDG